MIVIIYIKVMINYYVMVMIVDTTVLMQFCFFGVFFGVFFRNKGGGC